MAGRGGGGRGGRGARRGPGGLEAENKFQVSYDPKPAYPKMLNPPPRIETNDWEADCVANMISINRRRKLEPYYVPGVAGNPRITKSRAATSTAKFDPFSGPATYSQKYHLAARTAPDFKSKAWMKSILPSELHFTVDPAVAKPSWMDESEKKGATTATATKKSTKAAANLNLIDGNEDEDEEEDLDKEAEPEEQDENWEEDEDEDMDYEKGEKDDYNAEQYFDNGEDDGDAFGGDADGDY